VWGVGSEWPSEIAGLVRLGIVPEHKHIINYDHATKNCKNFTPNIHHKDHNLPEHNLILLYRMGWPMW